MAKSKKIKKATKNTNKENKNTKRRGRPPGSKNKQNEENNNNERNELVSIDQSLDIKKPLNTEEYDEALIKELKNNRKAKEKATFEEEYNPDDAVEEEEDEELDIEGYDIETTEGLEIEELSSITPKKTRRRRKKNYYDDFGIDNEFYESDYNIGEFEDYE